MTGLRGFATALTVTLVLGLAVAGTLLKGSLEATARKALEAVAGDMTGQSVTFDALRFDYRWPGSWRLGLVITKPEGFDPAAVFKFDAVHFQLAPLRLLADPTIIEEMRIDSPFVTYRLAAEAVSSPGKGAASAGLKARDFVIERLRLRGGFLLIDASGLERALRIAMPDLELREIGKDAAKATPGEAIRQIVDDALSKAKESSEAEELSALADDIDRALQDLGTSLGEDLKAMGQAIGEAAEETGKAIQELFQDQ